MKRNVTTEKVVRETREGVFSDFSGTELPSFHWSTVTKFSAAASDACGNGQWNRSLDLMPEEMRDLLEGIDQLIASLKTKYRKKGGAS